MTIEVDYLATQDIEAEARELIKSYEYKYGEIKTASTPVENIIENHLGLSFEIMDLGHPDILGQIDIQEKIIRANATLDPDAFPNKEGRFNYTLGHETGHWVLHRSYVEQEKTASLFGEKNEKIILCRKEDQKQRIEIQADMFSSFLLMPARKVYKEFTEYLNRPNGIEIEKVIYGQRSNEYFLNRCIPSWRIYKPSDQQILHHTFSEMAEKFKVSRQAMVIRLKNLGLLKEHKDDELRL